MKCNELVKNGKPFALSLLTVDTHFGNKLLPEAKREFGDIRDFIMLQSQLIADFVNWILHQPFGKNTVIVILGDHNMMTTKLGNIPLPEQERRVFNCIVNSKSGKKLGRDCPAAMVDVAPTILEALGVDWSSHAFGIGRSLYNSEKTCLEKYGFEKFQEETSKRSRKYRELIE